MNNTGSVEQARAVVVDTNLKQSTSAASQGSGPAKTESQSGKALPLSAQSGADDIVVRSQAPGTQSNQQVEQAVARLNEYAQSIQRDLRFSLDEDLGRSIIHVVDRNTKEVIRQIPNETALELARNLNERAMQNQQLEVEGLEAQRANSSVSTNDGSLGLINIRI